LIALQENVADENILLHGVAPWVRAARIDRKHSITARKQKIEQRQNIEKQIGNVNSGYQPCKTTVFRQSPTLGTTENHHTNANGHRARFKRLLPSPHLRYQEGHEKAVAVLQQRLQGTIEGRATSSSCKTAFCGLSITTNLSGMARTRAGLSAP
jgi:hypothetical protein